MGHGTHTPHPHHGTSDVVLRRVALTHPDPTISHAITDLLSDSGFDVINCNASDLARLAAPAVVVISGADVSDPAVRSLLAKVRHQDPQRTIIIEATPLHARLHEDELRDYVVVLRPLRRGTLLAEVEKAISAVPEPDHPSR